MGRNKIDIQYLKDDRIRNITFNKRKNGLLKKACELAVLCNIKMLLCFTDLSGNVYQFTSTENIEMEMIQSNHKKVFTKQDVLLKLILQIIIIFQISNEFLYNNYLHQKILINIFKKIKKLFQNCFIFLFNITLKYLIPQYPGFQKRKESESQSEVESEQSIDQKRTRASNKQQQIQQLNHQQQQPIGQQQMRLRNKIENTEKIQQQQQQQQQQLLLQQYQQQQQQQQQQIQFQQDSRKMVKMENKQEEQDGQKSKMRVKNKMNNNDEILVNEIIDHQQARIFDDFYQCGNCYDEQSNSIQDHHDYKQQQSVFTNSNPIKLMKMDSLLNGINNSKPNNFLSEQYNKFFNKDRIDSLNNSKVLQPSVQFIVPPQVYFNIPPSPISQAMNKVYVGVDEPMEYNLGQSQYMDGFKKYSK